MSSTVMTTTKKSVNAIKAPVIFHVDCRSGHRTCRSSYQDPLRYCQNAANGFGVFLRLCDAISAVFLTTFGFSSRATALFSVESEALMRVTFVSVGCFATDDVSQFKKSACCRLSSNSVMRRMNSVNSSRSSSIKYLTVFGARTERMYPASRLNQVALC